MKKIVQAYLGNNVMAEAETVITEFIQRRDRSDAGDLATDQLLNAIYLVTRERSPVGDDKKTTAQLTDEISHKYKIFLAFFVAALRDRN